MRARPCYLWVWASNYAGLTVLSWLASLTRQLPCNCWKCVSQLLAGQDHAEPALEWGQAIAWGAHASAAAAAAACCHHRVGCCPLGLADQMQSSHPQRLSLLAAGDAGPAIGLDEVEAASAQPGAVLSVHLQKEWAHAAAAAAGAHAPGQVSGLVCEGGPSCRVPKAKAAGIHHARVAVSSRRAWCQGMKAPHVHLL